ncbi:MAG: hypothetical protein IBX55_00185 [Methyloprofundus sp.]|nr:hypothetical protein [Methyloprofundus sp.]
MKDHCVLRESLIEICKEADIDYSDIEKKRCHPGQESRCSECLVRFEACRAKLKGLSRKVCY